MVALSIRKLGQPERVNKEMYNSVRAASGILVLGQIKKSTAFGTPSHIHKCTHIHTHTHTHIHTHMHTYTHTHTHTHTLQMVQFYGLIHNTDHHNKHTTNIPHNTHIPQTTTPHNTKISDTTCILSLEHVCTHTHTLTLRLCLHGNVLDLVLNDFLLFSWY